MLLAFKALSLVAFIGAAAWCARDPKADSLVATLTTLAAFVGTLVAERSYSTPKSQKQSVASHGLGVQAGRDANIGSIQTTREERKNAK